MASQSTTDRQEIIRIAVREGYGKIAEGTSQGCCGPSSCCGSDTVESAEILAQAIGYDQDDLTTLPQGANMGLSCGNPVALASLRPGEVVVDLGSGGGFDAFIAARRIGPTGRVIGVDMTPEMLSKARRNASDFSGRTGLHNIEFRLGEIEHLPLADNSVDVIISNCVINLSPDKPQVWREISRVLRPGGRVAVSDLALLRPLPDSIRVMVEALVGCIAGAVLVEETDRMVRGAGLVDVSLESKSDYIDAMTGWEDPLYQKILATLPTGSRVADYVTSLAVNARKPS
jgi:arsenite methyltransferase